MSNADIDHNETISEGILQSFQWLDRLLIASVILSSSIVLYKILGKEEITFNDVEIPTTGTPILFIILTLVHIYILKNIHDSSWESWESLSKTERERIYLKLTRTGGPMTKGAVQYKNRMSKNGEGLELFTAPSDAATWVHSLLGLMALAAMIRFEWSALALIDFFFAYVILTINWKIGASELMILADMGRGSDNSIYYVDGQKGVRFISVISGFWVGEGRSFSRFTRNTIHATISEGIIYTFFASILFVIISAVAWVIFKIIGG